MVSNKKRLYVALYPTGTPSTGTERKYHWALLVGPNIEDGDNVPGTRFHVRNPFEKGWKYEEHALTNVRKTDNRLVRVLIAKVEDETRLVDIFRSVPVIQNDPNWRCRTWVINAIAAVKKDGRAVGMSILDWERIETAAKDYAGKKTDAGRYRDANDPRPTWDMLEGCETVP